MSTPEVMVLATLLSTVVVLLGVVRGRRLTAAAQGEARQRALTTSASARILAALRRAFRDHPEAGQARIELEGPHEFRAAQQLEEAGRGHVEATDAAFIFVADRPLVAGAGIFGPE